MLESKYILFILNFRNKNSKLDDYYFKIIHFREKSAVKKISMEGLSYHQSKQDSGTRNEQVDIESKNQEDFSQTLKNKSGNFKTPARNNSINQTPKLIGLSKLVKFNNLIF